MTWLHTDQLNTPRIGTDSNQVIVWRWDSDAFGLGTPNEDPDGNSQNVSVDLRFPGQIASDGGVYYNYFRDYDPSTGRYIESDPIGLGGGLNTYGYVGGSPLLYVDPLGLFFNKSSCGPGGIYCDELVGVAASQRAASSVVNTVGSGVAVSVGEQCKDNDDPCEKILQEIRKAMKDLMRRYNHQCRDKKGQWVDHLQAYYDSIQRLRKLIKRAEDLGCPVPGKAYDWLSTSCPAPGMSIKDNPSPGY